MPENPPALSMPAPGPSPGSYIERLIIDIMLSPIQDTEHRRLERLGLFEMRHMGRGFEPGPGLLPGLEALVVIVRKLGRHVVIMSPAHEVHRNLEARRGQAQVARLQQL